VALVAVEGDGAGGVAGQIDYGAGPALLQASKELLLMFLAPLAEDLDAGIGKDWGPGAAEGRAVFEQGEVRAGEEVAEVGGGVDEAAG
jgi:hypothetical protein